MPTLTLDVRGERCPQPTLRLGLECIRHNEGDIIEVLADCPSFEPDLKSWATRTKKQILWLRRETDHIKAQVRV